MLRVLQGFQAGQALAIDLQRLRDMRHQRNDRRMMAGTDPPHVQIGDAILAQFHALANLPLQAGRCRGIEQDATGVAHQPQRPACDHQRADQAHRRVHP